MLWLCIVSCHENFCGFGSNCQNLKTILEIINFKSENVRKNAETIDFTIGERSKTTWTKFWTFLTPLPPWWTVLLNRAY